VFAFFFGACSARENPLVRFAAAWYRPCALLVEQHTMLRWVQHSHIAFLLLSAFLLLTSIVTVSVWDKYHGPNPIAFMGNVQAVELVVKATFVSAPPPRYRRRLGADSASHRANQQNKGKRRRRPRLYLLANKDAHSTQTSHERHIRDIVNFLNHLP
jgi:hypothetical protein